MNSSSASFFFSLPDALVFHLTGRDCSRYLHARVSNNVRDLPPLAGCAAAALNPQGRTELFGTVLKISAEEFYVVCDGGTPGEVTPALLRYKVADRVECILKEDLKLLHVTHSPALQEAAPALYALAGTREFQILKAGTLTAFTHQRTTVPGIDVFGPKDEIEQLKAQLENRGVFPLDASQQLVERIKAHRPGFPSELNDQGIFLESGLGHAVSFTKGCYVGQEVIEKVDSHGRLPFSLVSLVSSTAVSSAPVPESAVLTAAGTVAGEVVGSAIDTHSGSIFCFARIKTATISPDSLFTIEQQEYRLT